jgi:plastocyanin
MKRTALITLLGMGIMAAPAGAATVDVRVSGFAFAPADLTITQGDTVTWTFAGPDTNHSTTTAPGPTDTWDSDPGNPAPNHNVGDKFSVTFSNVGEFSYFCKVHSNMTGKVIVQAAGTPAPTPPDTVAPKFGTLRASVVRRRVTFKLDEAAQVVGKLRGPKTRRTFTLAAKVGTNVLKLPKKLAGGRYRLVLTATDAAGNPSLPAVVTLTVPKALKR